jgi:FlaA1/EpsC-like NDP-sugar epimerase
VRLIEPEDLLGREPVQLDEAGIAEALGARYGPARLVLYELSEFNLYTIEQELSESFPQLPLVKLIGDVKDLEHLRLTF